MSLIDKEIGRINAENDLIKKEKKKEMREKRKQAREFANEQLPKEWYTPVKFIVYDEKSEEELQEDEIPGDRALRGGSNILPMEERVGTEFGSAREERDQIKALKRKQRDRKKLVRANTRNLLGGKWYPQILLYNLKRKKRTGQTDILDYMKRR